MGACERLWRRLLPRSWFQHRNSYKRIWHNWAGYAYSRAGHLVHQLQRRLGVSCRGLGHYDRQQWLRWQRYPYRRSRNIGLERLRRQRLSRRGFGDDNSDERIWRLGYPLPGCGHGGHDFLGPDLRCQRSLLWGDDYDRLWVSSAGRRQLLLNRMLQLRWLVRCRGSGRGSCGGRSGWRRCGFGQYGCRYFQCCMRLGWRRERHGSASNAAAYNAGVAAGASYAMGEIVAAAPTGCATPVVGGVTYYLCGNTWLQPAYGANGIYYRVVPAP